MFVFLDVGGEGERLTGRALDRPDERPTGRLVLVLLGKLLLFGRLVLLLLGSLLLLDRLLLVLLGRLLPKEERKDK